MAARVTIDDIARLAGVSKATVSRVINQKPDIDPAIRSTVLRIMQEQDFVPSAGVCVYRPSQQTQRAIGDHPWQTQ
jgi:DNA-binding LacI/PurR family transcriptional regulator